MKCVKCQKEILNNSLYCNICGAKQPTTNNTDIVLKQTKSFSECIAEVNEFETTSNNPRPIKTHKTTLSKKKLMMGLGLICLIAILTVIAILTILKASHSSNNKSANIEETIAVVPSETDLAEEQNVDTESASKESSQDIILEGMYLVGTDILAGTYKLTQTGEYSGYWERSRDASGETSSIIASDNFNNTSYVTVKDGEYLIIKRSNAIFFEGALKERFSPDELANTFKKTLELTNVSVYGGYNYDKDLPNAIVLTSVMPSRALDVITACSSDLAALKNWFDLRDAEKHICNEFVNMRDEKELSDIDIYVRITSSDSVLLLTIKNGNIIFDKISN